MMNTKIYGHRGASAYRPENTLESFELAFKMGVPAVEFDLVPTKDGQLLIRHEPELARSTNVKQVEALAAFGNDGKWYSHDMSLADIRLVRAVEPEPEVRPASAEFDGQFAVPSFADLLAADFAQDKTLIIELKWGGYYFEKKGVDLAAMLADELTRGGWLNRGDQLVIESFDYNTVKRAMAAIRPLFEGAKPKFIYLTANFKMADWGSVEAAVDGAVAGGFDGISFEKELLTHELVAYAKSKGLTVFGWTLFAEEAETTVEEYFAKYMKFDLDGVFVDHPDLLLNFVEGFA